MALIGVTQCRSILHSDVRICHYLSVRVRRKSPLGLALTIPVLTPTQRSHFDQIVGLELRYELGKVLDT